MLSGGARLYQMALTSNWGKTTNNLQTVITQIAGIQPNIARLLLVIVGQSAQRGFEVQSSPLN